MKIKQTMHFFTKSYFNIKNFTTETIMIFIKIIIDMIKIYMEQLAIN